MFTKSDIVLYITKTQIQAVKLTQTNPIKQEVVAKMPFTPDSLKDTLVLLGKNSGKEVSIILDDDLIYVTTLFFTSASQITSRAIEQKAQEIIPETLSQTFWNFKSLSLPQTSLGIPIQIVAITTYYFSSLAQAIQETGIHVKTCMPLSFVLAESLQEAEPVVMLYVNARSLLIASNQHIPFATQRFSKTVTSKDIDEFLAYIQKTQQITIKKLVLCGNVAQNSLESFKSQNYTVSTLLVNPTATIAKSNESWEKKHDIFYKVVLLLREKNTKQEFSDDALPLDKPQKSMRSKIYLILLCITILIVIFGFLATLLTFLHISLPFFPTSQPLVRPLPGK
jgi:hypothetical protein